MNPNPHGLTHFDEKGASRMVEVSQKAETPRMARAQGLVRMSPQTQELIRNRAFAKGDVLEVARLAGIQAAKRTWELIPLCHQVPLTGVQVNFSFPGPDQVEIEAISKTIARTGVEMEALVAVSVAGLTIYDMCKSVDRVMELHGVRLMEKTGGQNGDYFRDSSTPGAPAPLLMGGNPE